MVDEGIRGEGEGGVCWWMDGMSCDEDTFVGI